MNNKGFAISGILYTILIIFVVSISIMLFNLQNRKTILDELKTEAVEAVESDNNYEYLLDRINQLEAKLGTEDISGVGDGTVNGAISNLSVGARELVPILTSNNDKGFVVTASSEYSEEYQAYHAFDGVYSEYYYIDNSGMLNRKTFHTDTASKGEGANTWIMVKHSFPIAYKYIYLHDRSSGWDSEKSTTVSDTITQYKIYGLNADDTFDELITYDKEAYNVEVKIPLYTSKKYYGFKVATTKASGNIGWYKIQMYV